MEVIAIIAIAIFCYFFPTFIASHRKHFNKNSIFLTNLFFGWTFIGWVACLIWAVSDNTEKSVRSKLGV